MFNSSGVVKWASLFLKVESSFNIVAMLMQLAPENVTGLLESAKCAAAIYRSVRNIHR